MIEIVSFWVFYFSVTNSIFKLSVSPTFNHCLKEVLCRISAPIYSQSLFSTIEQPEKLEFSAEGGLRFLSFLPPGP